MFFKKNKFRIDLKGEKELMDELERLNSIELEAIEKKNLTQIFNRARNMGRADSTPVKTGELRQSVAINNDEVGYTASYAPHVEYGHRQNVGQFVPEIGKRLKVDYVEGKHFFADNIARQQIIFRRDLRRALRNEKEIPFEDE